MGDLEAYLSGDEEIVSLFGGRMPPRHATIVALMQR